MKKNLLNVLLLAAGMVGSLSTYAQFGCGSAVVLSDGYTASAITTPGTGGAEDWNTNPTGTSISGSYWDDDVYIFEYTAVAATENISMTIFTRNSWNGIGIFDNCTGTTFDTELDALGSGGSSSVSQTVSATINAGNTVYIAIGQWGTPDNLDFDVTDFTVTAITCPDPNTLGVSNLMATSADLDWIEAGTAGEWNIEYGAPGFVLGAGTIVNTTTASPYNLGGLTAATDYEFYVRSICGPGDSSDYAGPFSFSTPCAVLSVPHVEDFTTWTPTCWDQAGDGVWSAGPSSVGASEWNHTSYLNGGGANDAVKVNLYNVGSNEWMLSPTFDLSSGGPYEMVLNAGVTTYNGTGVISMGTDDSVMVFISNDAGTTWDRIHVWAESNNPGNSGATELLDLSAYSSATTTFAIYAAEGATDDVEDYDFHIGNFEIRMPLACADPIGFTATAIDTNEIELTWTPGGTETEWLIEYGTTGFTPGTGTQESTMASPDTITALLTSQGYQFYIQAVCAPGDSSTWVGPIAATTLAPPAYCITGVGPTSTADSNLDGVAMTGETTSIAFTNSCAPAPIGVIDETAQAADVLTGYNYSIDVSAGTCGGNYTNGLAVWVDWNQDLTFDPSEQVGVSSGTAPYSSTFSFDVPTDALLGTTRMRVMQHETTGTLDPCGSYSWGGVADFTIDVAYGTSCAPITGLTADYIGLDSVAVSWTANGSESGWNFELGTAGFTPGTATEVYGSNPTTASDSLNGLMTGTDYDVYVQADCGADSSVWVGPLSITTLLTCPEPSGLGGTVISSDSISLFWTPGDSLEVEWLIEYGIDGFTPGTGTQVASFTNPSDTISGLDGATTYDFYIQGVCGAADSSFWFGPFTLSTPVANDDPCNAISLPIDSVEYQYSNFGATASTEEAALVIPAGTGAAGTCNSTDGWCSFELTVTKAMWFSFDAPASGNVNINCSGTTYDGQLAVFDGDCSDLPSMTLIGANDDAVAGGLAPELALCGLTPGMTYYVMHDEYAGSGDGTISFVLSEVPTSAGNDGSLDVCESDSTNLFNGITSAAENGVWALLSDPAAIVNDSLIDASVLAVGTYDVLYILNNTCATDTAHATVNVLGAPSAGTAVSPIEACNTEAFSLMTGLTGTVDLGGTWSDDSSTGLLVGDSFNALGVTPGSYDFTYTVSNGVCADVSTTITVEVDDCVGIGENQSLDFTVYPNPNNGSFAIRNNGVTNEVVITVIDLNGKEVYSESKVLDGVELLPIDLNVDSGIYRLSITSDASVSSYKVVVE